MSKRAHRRERIKKRLAQHWTRLLYLQLAAYGVVLALWLLPIPNPVKLLAVTFHELSHALAALATGGRVFGYAIDPAGAGVTMGVGGNLLIILLAGYVGSCIFGLLLYYVSVAWKPNTALFSLLVLVIGTAMFGWLNSYTMVFGIGAAVLMMALFPMRDEVKLFFIRLVGSACCLYALLEVIGEIVPTSRPPNVMGAATRSDITQLADVTGAHPAAITIAIVAVQSAILVWAVRWTCKAGAKSNVRREVAAKSEIRQRLRDIRSIK